MTENKQSCENLALRVLWTAVFVLVWRVAELVLLAVVLVQLVYRLFKGRPHVDVMNFGDSLSQYLAQIGRFGSFHSDEKPWPFSDWPTPREPQGEGAAAVSAADVRPPEPAAPRDESAVEDTPSGTPDATASAPAAEPPVAAPQPDAAPAPEGTSKPEAGPDTPAEPKK
ncbi:protein of unknown function [Pseudomonas oryzae]|uniref:DUF4389 domain-containing protein n=1 Tax=Pseudomonas oryzae TaxID=1392877 RepID=A0A1H1S5U8_9PSED|nr:protein of unknown function [Pseudomonas oryzae]